MVDPYRIETTPNFERGFKRLDPAIARRIISKVEQLAAERAPNGYCLFVH